MFVVMCDRVSDVGVSQDWLSIGHVFFETKKKQEQKKDLLKTHIGSVHSLNI